MRLVCQAWRRIADTALHRLELTTAKQLNTCSTAFLGNLTDLVIANHSIGHISDEPVHLCELALLLQSAPQIGSLELSLHESKR